MSERPKVRRSEALDVAARVMGAIGCQHFVRVEVAGSLRRRQDMVGDIELVYIPVVEMRPVAGDLFGLEEPVNLVDARLDELLAEGILAKRPKVDGTLTWGERNKLALHVASGIGVDLFATTEDCWHNYLVCRTGPKASNMRISNAAQARGLSWKPYQQGFEAADGSMIPVHSEEDVFRIVGLEYLEPWERDEVAI